jgi:flagellar biosynthesis anti-sigma factor FlgM
MSTLKWLRMTPYDERGRIGRMTMAGVKKTSGASDARAVVHDFSKARSQATTGDGVELADSSGSTPAARELSAAHQIVEETDEIRAERVRALKEQIAKGTYHPDPREIARKLLERGF